MDRAYFSSLMATHAEQILYSLAQQQFLHPHQTVGDAMNEAGRAVGFCAGAAETAAQWLGVDREQSIGRLRRTELVQLARAISRFWQQDPVDIASDSHSA